MFLCDAEGLYCLRAEIALFRDEKVTQAGHTGMWRAIGRRVR